MHGKYRRSASRIYWRAGPAFSRSHGRRGRTRGEPGPPPPPQGKITMILTAGRQQQTTSPYFGYVTDGQSGFPEAFGTLTPRQFLGSEVTQLWTYSYPTTQCYLLNLSIQPKLPGQLPFKSLKIECLTDPTLSPSDEFSLTQPPFTSSENGNYAWRGGFNNPGDGFVECSPPLVVASVNPWSSGVDGVPGHPLCCGKQGFGLQQIGPPDTGHKYKITFTL